MIENLTVIGPGLIGGSLIRALRENNGVKQVTGCSRDFNSLDRALKLGVIDKATTDVKESVLDADVVVIATPMGVIADIFKTIQPALKPGAVVTDVGSVKTSLINELTAEYGEVPAFFIPGHPVAGNEQSGMEASYASLFEDRNVILTPASNADSSALDKVRAMWELAGAEVVEMQAEWHDVVLSATSHLPHILAYALVAQLSNMSEAEDIFKFAAGGFRDLSRTASSDATMWRDICLTNADKISDMINSYQAQLTKIDEMIQAKDAEGLHELFSQAKKTRDSHFE